MQWSIKKLQRSWWEASLLFQLVLDYAASEKVLQSHLISSSYCWKKLCCTDALGVSALFSTLSMSFPLSLLLDQADTNFSMFLQLSSSDLTWEMVFSGLCPQAAADATPQNIVVSNALTCSWAYRRSLGIAWEVWICYIFRCHGHRYLFCRKHFPFFCLYSLSAAVHCGGVSSGQTKVSGGLGLCKWLPKWCWIIIFLTGLQYGVLKYLLTLVPILYLNHRLLHMTRSSRSNRVWVHGNQNAEEDIIPST